jgi:hypothetical protein
VKPSGSTESAGGTCNPLGKVAHALRFSVAALIWAPTRVVRIMFMIVMAWGCENEARRFGHRVATHYAAKGGHAAIAAARG